MDMKNADFRYEEGAARELHGIIKAIATLNE